MNDLIIKIIIRISEIKEAELDSLDRVDISYILSFSDFLNELFIDNDLTEEILYKINSIDTDIFTNKKYLYDFYKNNPIRKKIENYKKNHKEKEKLIFTKEEILKYLSECYELIEYVDLKKEDICDYIKVNEKVLYLLNSKFINKDILLKALKTNKKVALILDEEDKEGIYPKRKYYLKTKKHEFLRDENIYEIYIKDIIELLKKDISLYIKLSDIAKKDKDVILFVRQKDKKYLAFLK